METALSLLGLDSDTTEETNTSLIGTDQPDDGLCSSAATHTTCTVSSASSLQPEEEAIATVAAHPVVTDVLYGAAADSSIATAASVSSVSAVANTASPPIANSHCKKNTATTASSLAAGNITQSNAGRTKIRFSRDVLNRILFDEKLPTDEVCVFLSS